LILLLMGLGFAFAGWRTLTVRRRHCRARLPRHRRRWARPGHSRLRSP
jgi:hypothetical protein